MENETLEAATQRLNRGLKSIRDGVDSFIITEVDTTFHRDIETLIIQLLDKNRIRSAFPVSRKLNQAQRRVYINYINSLLPEGVTAYWPRTVFFKRKTVCSLRYSEMEARQKERERIILANPPSGGSSGRKAPRVPINLQA